MREYEALIILIAYVKNEIEESPLLIDTDVTETEWATKLLFYEEDSKDRTVNFADFREQVRDYPTAKEAIEAYLASDVEYKFLTEATYRLVNHFDN